MKRTTINAIRLYKSNIASARARYRLACKYNRPNMFDKTVCVPELDPMVIITYQDAMRQMRMECVSTDLWYRSQLLRAALGLIGPLVGPNVWSVES